MADQSKLSYTSRTFSEIRSELIEAIPSLTDKWQNFADDDPGIVLITLMASLGDMLNYNMDYQVLETFPSTATQRKNAARSYKLIGYQMQWFRSAKCTAVLTTESPVQVNVPAYSQFSTTDGISYSTVRDYNLQLVAGQNLTIDLVQGIPKVQQGMIADNITGAGRIYLLGQNVDQSNFYLVIGQERWTQVDNFLSEPTTGRYFEFRVDENDLPYIQLAPYYADFYELSPANIQSTDFTAKYLISSGSLGVIGENTLSRVITPLFTVQNSVATNITSFVSNTGSVGGFDPETPEEAIVNSENYAVTPNSLVTLLDYTNATNKLDGIGKSIAVNMNSTGGWVAGTTKPNVPFELWIYGVTDDTEAEDFPAVDQATIQEINTMCLERGVDVYTGGTTSPNTGFFRQGLVQPIQLQVKVYTTTPTTSDQKEAISANIFNAIKEYFIPSSREFGETLIYVDIISQIVASDSKIRYIDLKWGMIPDSGDVVLSEGNLTVPYNMLPSLRKQGVDYQVYSFFDGNGSLTITIKEIIANVPTPVQDVAIAVVDLSNAGNNVTLPNTDASGVSSVENIESGVYELTITKTGYKTVKLITVVNASETDEVSVTIEKEGA